MIEDESVILILDFSSVKDQCAHLADWWLSEDRRCNLKLRGAIIMLGWWQLWLERNLRVFQSKQRAVDILCDLSLDELRAWQLAGCKTVVYFR